VTGNMSIMGDPNKLKLGTGPLTFASQCLQVSDISCITMALITALVCVQRINATGCTRTRRQLFTWLESVT
jgi:hypothetical protein